MQTVHETTTTRKAPRAFYATLYNDEIHGVLAQVEGQLHFFTDAGEVLDYEPTMAPWLTILGEVGVTETARLLDTMHGGAAAICTSRQMLEV
jgi:hypothetical protein